MGSFSREKTRWTPLAGFDGEIGRQPGQFLDPLSEDAASVDDMAGTRIDILASAEYIPNARHVNLAVGHVEVR